MSTEDLPLGVVSSPGTLIARGILTLDGTSGIAGWKWLFIIEGVLTVGLAIVFGILLPNLPQSKWPPP